MRSPENFSRDNPYDSWNMDRQMIDQHMQAAYAHVMMLKPLIQYAAKEGKVTGTKHSLLEFALISHLMGIGHSFERSQAMVKSWEMNGKFPGEDSI